MSNRLFLRRAFVLASLVVAALLLLVMCQQDEPNDDAAAPVAAATGTAMVPQSSPTPPAVPTAEPPAEPSREEVAARAPTPPGLSPATTDMEDYLSVTDLFAASLPSGWSTAETVPGAALVLANSAQALARFTADGAVTSGDLVLNIGFLPLALLQEDDLAHLGFQSEASPEVFLRSLLPLFRVGADPAADVVGEPRLVTLRDDRDAGLVAVSAEGREGLILLFSAGDNVVALLSAAAFPGEIDTFRELTYAIAAGVTYSGAQDLLYGALYGG